MSSKIKHLLASFVFVLSTISFASAAEINLPGFTGTANTTLTSGLSVRIERNCVTEAGAISAGDGSAAFATAISSFSAAHQAALLASDTPGCAKQYTDGYGNTPDTTSGPRRSLLSANADDGNMNFDGGDVFDATSRVFTEISGRFDNGTSLNLSFVGSYNPVTSFNNPTWAPFTSDQLSDIETNIDLLDAYVTMDVANSDMTVTAGQFVTNWGESTFIPVGMNGLTTNAIDLSKLRVPGSSIREALVPAPQISLTGYLDNGWSYDAYVQLDETHVEVDEGGMFFGNEVVKGDRLTFTSAFRQNSQQLSEACGLLIAGPTLLGGANTGCDADAISYFNGALGGTASTMYRFQAGFSGLLGDTNSSNILIKSMLLAAGADQAASIGGAGGGVQTVSSVGFGTTNAGIAGVTAAYNNWDEYTRKAGRKVGALDAEGGKHIYADGEEQFGLALRTYLDNVGSGVDLGIYFAQYDSKAPYLRFKGQRGIHAGDLVGAFTFAAQCAGTAGCDDDAGGGAGTSFADGDYQSASGQGDGAITAFENAESTALSAIYSGLVNTAYGEAACGAYQNPKAVNKLYGGDNAATATNFAWSSAQKDQALRYYNYTEINGKLYHDSIKCYANAQNDGSGADFNTAATQAAAAALLGAAVTPLNLAEYEFVYPENIQAMGISANTNINGTTVQAELTYRPDFPLATNGGDQGQQLSDSAGTTNLLSIGVAQGVRGPCALTGEPGNDHDGIVAFMNDPTHAHQIAARTAACTAQMMAVNSYRAGTGDTDAEWADVVGAIKSFNRSSLPRISLADIAAGDYYTTPYIEYDVWSGTVGTTTSFSASHPIVNTLGADSAVFLSEFGFVHVPDLDYSKGGVNRGGYRDGVGGSACGGVTNGGAVGATNYGAYGARALDAATHLGSSQTDPLFGNGSYCESRNTIDETSMTYRLIGSATYNNVVNSAWTFSPSFVWSHDFSGYGPTSLGGFVPGKQSLSLSGNLSKGDVKVGMSYVNQLGDEMDNLNFDKDYISANVSYAF